MLLKVLFQIGKHKTHQKFFVMMDSEFGVLRKNTLKFIEDKTTQR